MPQLVTFQGRPVKRRKRIAGGLLLTFYGAERQVAGVRIAVSDDDWRRHGRIDYYAPGELPDVRALVANTLTKSLA